MSFERLDERTVLSVSATFAPASGELTIFGDSNDNIIAVSRTVPGNLLVNGGSLVIEGGSPSVANTVRIKMFGGDGQDQLSLDETNGALPSAHLFGEGGNDSLVGGFGADLLLGGDGNDSLSGQGGNDELFGGADHDTLVGGTGLDLIFGEAGNDIMLWNPCDETDLVEGGLDVDQLVVHGDQGDEQFTLTANGTRVRFDRIQPSPIALDIAGTESIVVNMNGGNDSFSAAGNLAALIQVTVDGGIGNDSILGSNGADILRGGMGDDFLDGNQGNDTIMMGDDTDTFQWDPGDGNDVVEGQGGFDKLLFHGSGASEIMELSANGARTRFTRNVGAIVLDLDDIERIDIAALGGADVILVKDLAETGVQAVNVNLAGTLGGTSGDTQLDQVIVNATNGSDTVSISGTGSDYSMTGLATLITVLNSEGANDQFTVNALAGNDVMNASSLVAGIVKLTLDGGTGADWIEGSRGGDVLLGGMGQDFVRGGMGDDLVLLGEGNDAFSWNHGDGNDIVEGQAGTDRVVFQGSNSDENMALTANASRVRFTRDVANVLLDMNEVERLEVFAQGGADTLTVGDLIGTGMTRVRAELGTAQAPATGDGQSDRVTVQGTTLADRIRVKSVLSHFAQELDQFPFDNMAMNAAAKAFVARQEVAVTTTWGQVNLSNTEGPLDTLSIQSLAGADLVDASGLKAGLIGLVMNGGTDADRLMGSEGNDVLDGDQGNDLVLMGGGDDMFVWDPGDGSDTVEGQQGFDRLQFNGSNVSENLAISANGPRVRFTRDVAAITLDLNGLERMDLATLGGSDVITVHDLTGTDMVAVDVN
ncbi:MAG TPA: calcium-binding protein, partial [Pirellulaceae bacterium]